MTAPETPTAHAQTAPATTHIPAAARRMLPVLALLSATAPLATDMYLPAFPEMAVSFGVDASRIQLTLTTFLLGMALGQLLVGPLSDDWGRRRLLLWGTVICFFSTLACALAPSIELLTTARLFQGISGGAGVVLARAIIADTVQGPAMARMMGIMMLIVGVAPITAPVLGSLLLNLGGWHVIFMALAVLVAAMFFAALWRIPETLPPSARHGGGLRALFGHAGQVLRQRRYVGYLATGCGSFAALFAYIAASPFVVQGVLGLSPNAYGLTFAANAVGLVACGAVSVRLAGRVRVRRLLSSGLIVLWITSALQLVNLFTLTSLPLTLLLMWISTASFGLIFGNSIALALAEVPRWRGTGSAFLGSCQFAVGALVSPLVGLGGTLDARPMGIVMFLGASLSVLAMWKLTGTHASRQP